MKDKNMNCLSCEGNCNESTIHLNGPEKITLKHNIIRKTDDTDSLKGSTILEFNAQQQIMKGDIVSDLCSGILIILKDSSVFEGKISGASIELDMSSVWKVTANSSVGFIKCLKENVMDLILLIQDNGHTITYDTADSGSDYLLAKTYKLISGGELVPFVR